jgi:hypothetical protein
MSYPYQNPKESRLSLGEAANQLTRYHGRSNGETLYRQMYQALACHIPDEQFAFLPGRDTTLQVLRFTEHVTDMFNRRTYAAGIFLDVFKAYDTVWITGLIYKLHAVSLF